ncbi:hypothetical protein XENTR_v10022240 [Xenopus tropicalis]|nr:hypothetical protein XENTR_v10022240 [Xenopus tropicalis]
MCSVSYILIILLVLPGIVGGQSKYGCALNLAFSPHYYVDGDFIIAGSITVCTHYLNYLTRFQVPTRKKECSNFNVWNYQNVLAFVFAITQINNNPDLLPNITLGFHIVDNCLAEEQAVLGMLDIMSGDKFTVPNYHCGLSQDLLAVVDGISTRLSLLFARLFGIYMVPQISYNSLDPILRDKIHFPTVYLTIPSDNFQYLAIVKFLKHFSWTWVGILVSDDEFGLKISQLLLEELARNGIGPFNGSLAFTPYKGAMPGFKEFISSIKPELYPKDIFIVDAWFELFQCTYNKTLSLCTGDEKTQYERFNEEVAHNSYSIYNAVYVLAHALHLMQLEKMKENRNKNDNKPWQLNKYLKNIHFTNGGGETMLLNENGEIHSKFDILNWVIYANQTLRSIKVGSYDHQNTVQGLIVNESLIRWNPAFNQTPRSACSETCINGFRRTSKQGFPACCYDCIPCPEGWITNTTDMKFCIKCPQTQWPNEKKDTCLDTVIIYLSFADELGTSIAFLSILFFFFTCLVMGVFTKYRTTPIVKAKISATFSSSPSRCASSAL